MEAGLRETLNTDVAVGGLIVSCAVLTRPKVVAVIVGVVIAATVLVVTVNVPVVLPAATGTFAGTVAAALSLESATAKPPAGAAASSVTVPVVEVPPITVVGLRATDTS